MDDLQIVGATVVVAALGVLLYYLGAGKGSAARPGRLAARGAFQLPAVDLGKDDVRAERQRDFCRYFRFTSYFFASNFCSSRSSSLVNSLVQLVVPRVGGNKN